MVTRGQIFKNAAPILASIQLPNFQVWSKASLSPSEQDSDGAGEGYLLHHLLMTQPLSLKLEVKWVWRQTCKSEVNPSS